MRTQNSIKRTRRVAPPRLPEGEVEHRAEGGRKQLLSLGDDDERTRPANKTRDGTQGGD